MVIVILAATAWATLGPGAEPVHTITGEMALRDSDRFDYDVGDSCSGSGGYSDIAQGAPVTVKNQSGTVIGSGSLGPGTIEGDTTAVRACVFPFQVDDVSDAEFFQVEISRRGVLSYSKADMEANGWTLHFSLGNE